MAKHPLWTHDRKAMGSNPQGLVGVDEVGRGAWAGPVIAAAVWLKPAFFMKRSLYRPTQAIGDSKKITAKTRLYLFEIAHLWKKQGLLTFALGSASAEEVDTLNVLGATKKAMAEALNTLAVQPSYGSDPLSLFTEHHQTCEAPSLWIDGKPLTPFPWPHQSLIKGDGKSLSIALASILAKVHRDRLMETLDSTYPAYGLAAHKGYGTPQHQEAIAAHGLCPIHRQTFVPIDDDTTTELSF